MPLGVWVFKNFFIRSSGKLCEVAGLMSLAFVRSGEQTRLGGGSCLTSVYKISWEAGV